MLYNAFVTRQSVKVMIRDCSGATEETFENMVVDLYACPLNLSSLKEKITCLSFEYNCNLSMAHYQIDF